MTNKRKTGFLAITVVLGLLSVAHMALAQSTDVKPPQQMPGSTQPAPGAHDHSSSPTPGEGKEMPHQHNMQNMPNMPAAPGPSGGPATGQPKQ